MFKTSTTTGKTKTNTKKINKQITKAPFVMLSKGAVCKYKSFKPTKAPLLMS